MIATEPIDRYLERLASREPTPAVELLGLCTPPRVRP